MDAIFKPLAEATGSSLDQIKVRSLQLRAMNHANRVPQLITCLLISYPLGSVFIRIPDGQSNLKHMFNIAITVFYFLPVLALWSGFFQLLGDVLATYYIAKNVKGKNMPWIVFA